MAFGGKGINIDSKKMNPLKFTKDVNCDFRNSK